MKKDINPIKLKIRQIFYDYANEPDFVIKEKYGDKSEKSFSDVIVDLIEKEVIGKDLQPEMRLDKGEKLRPEASLAEYGAFINYISNNTKREMRKELQ